MKLINCIILILISLFSVCAQAAAPASAFPRESVMSKGRWVKIYIDKTGVYEISDDELKSMGFNPNKVFIYGRGGDLQPTQFVSSKGEAYQSDLQPVATKRGNGVTYFYAQATQKVDYLFDNDSYTDQMRFDRASNQVYATDVAYFITDTGVRNDIQQVSSGKTDSSLPALESAWSYCYHEVDNFTYGASGRDFYGESFVNERTQQFPYYLPSVVSGTSGSITCLFGARSNTNTVLEYGFEGGELIKSSIPFCSQIDNFRFNAKKYGTITLPSEKGNITVRYTGTGNEYFAALDYLVVSGKRTFAFGEGETQFAAYPYEFTAKKYKWLEMPASEGEIGVWQVTNSNAVKELKCEKEGDMTRVMYLSDNHRGPVVFVDYSKPQYKIKGYEEVNNQNLHALGTVKIPAMLIITLPELKPAADRLAALHKEKDGIEVAVVLNEDVINEFSAGVADPMAYRALAKMLYDRDNPDNRVFKNILLFGPNVRDYRNVLNIVPEIGTLISNQSYDSSNFDFSFCTDDWYGMMQDVTDSEQNSAYSFYKVSMHVGVGIVPVNDLKSANEYVDKVQAYYADSSFAYWLTNFNYLADGGDNNEHQTWEENLHNQMTDYTVKAGLGTKIYNNLNSLTSGFEMFKKRVDEGAMLTFFTGHATSSAIGNGLVDVGDERKFNNTRYGFSLWGACDVAPFDNNEAGVAAKMVLQRQNGFIATLGTTRAGYSRKNYVLLNNFQKAMLCEDMEAGKPLASKRTLGESYVMAKNATCSDANKFAFHLIGDPALTLPLPTASVELNFDDAADEIYPGSQVKFSGKITGRDGKLLSDYTGTLVLKICAPAVNMKTNSWQSSPSVNVRLDQTTLSVNEYAVKGGKFEGVMLIPNNTPQTSAEPVTLRAAAYDPVQRKGAAGALSLSVKDYNADKAVASDNAPVIESMYAVSPEVGENDAVPSNFMLYADITDDFGIMAYEREGVSSMYMTIDNRNTKFDVHNHITVNEGGKRVQLAYPVKDMAAGNHLLKLTVSDANNQYATRTLNVKVGGVNTMSKLHTDVEGPVRKQVTFTLNETTGSATQHIRIVDSQGHRHFYGEMKGGKYVWNLKDNADNRVSPGVYYAIGIQNDAKAGNIITEPCEVIVF
ncbi:MAG: C25 family cysteine peptidase [Prevotella sp.]|nr:C25 family cysteine peptidase [Prevotella sp.]MCM1075436.1 C25 family cysteine peptidase [Ruminococcus sp.]